MVKMDFPKELKYLKTHEYLRALPENKAFVGLTSYATSELGDIVFIELPEVGRTFKAQEKFGVIESVKSVSDLYMPHAGKIVEVNNLLNEHPEHINESPYEKGWLIKIEMTSPLANNKELISDEEYSKFVLATTH